MRYDVTYTATDPAGYVEATVRRDGRLHSLRIDPHAMYDLTAVQLATACLDAVERAQSICAPPSQREPGRIGGRWHVQIT